MVKITVITVVKNNRAGIEKTIKSVLSQTQERIEHIVVDGMSNDGTTEIISKYKKKLKHIREHDNGIYQAINKGIKAARGEYIGLLHSGDEYCNEYSLDRAIYFIEKNNLNASSSNMLYKNKKKLIRYWKLPIQKLNKFSIFKIAHPTLIVKRKLISNPGYSERYSISSDVEFMLNLSKLRNLKYGYYDHDLQINQYGGISTSKKYIFKKLREDIEIFRKHFKFIYIFALTYKIIIKFKSFINTPEEYDILFLNYYFSDQNGIGDKRHIDFFQSLSSLKIKTLILGCENNHFQRSSKYLKKYFNNALSVQNISSIKYENNFQRVLSILFFNLKLLFNFKKFKKSKKIFITVPDYSSVIVAFLFSKIFNKDLIVEFRDVYPENIKPYFKNNFLYKVISIITTFFEIIAIKYSKIVISNLPLYTKRFINNYREYKNKLEILPNLINFNGFNRKKNFIYAGSMSLVNNINVIDNFIKNIDVNKNKVTKYLISKKKVNEVSQKKLLLSLKKYGFGIFSFNNINSVKYGMNHKKLNIYFDCGLVPTFIGNKKFKNYFFSYFPIFFINEQFSLKIKFELKKLYHFQKKLFLNEKKIKKNILKINCNTQKKLEDIFIYNHSI